MPHITKFDRDKMALCPFYRRESATQIKCDPIVGRFNLIDFATAAEKKDYKEDFCKGLYQSCAIYQVLEEQGGVW